MPVLRFNKKMALRGCLRREGAGGFLCWAQLNALLRVCAFISFFTMVLVGSASANVLSGYVFDSNGIGVGGFYVEASCDTCPNPVTGTTTTAADGSYSLPLLSGTYSVEITNRFSTPVYRASTIGINVSGPTVQNFTLSPLVALSGKVSDANGVGVANVTLSNGNPFVRISAVTAADGTYSMPAYAVALVSA